MCQKLIEMGPDSDLDEYAIRDSVSRELESACSVEKCFIMRQVGLTLYQAKKEDGMIFVPLTKGSIFTQTIETRRTVIVNEAPKDRDTVNEVRNAFNLVTMKVNNLMMVPVGENQGKKGGAMVIILINKFTLGEEDRP